jgi:AraC family transcriptional regulator, arabinose operon regulatory protein
MTFSIDQASRADPAARGMEVIHLGLGTTHDDQFVYSRPNGTGAWVFMHLPVALEIDTVEGRVRSKPGDCIVHDPHFAQMHRALRGGFHNDWMHFRGDAVAGLLAECRLPLNLLFRPGAPGFLRPLMLDLQRELAEQGLHWQRRVELLTTDLLAQLSRQMHGAAASPAGTRAEREHLGRMRAARQEMLTHLSRVWTVAELASKVNLSEPRFSALYRRLFNASPNDELIRARIDHARYLLAHTGLPVKRVAEQCGFESVAYFSRRFHQQVGCAPRDYLRLPQAASGRGGR